MTVSIRRAQAVGREDALAHAVQQLDAVETWQDFNRVLAELRERKAQATATIRDLS